MSENISKENELSNSSQNKEFGDLTSNNFNLEENLISTSYSFDFSKSKSVRNANSRTMNSVDVNRFRQPSNFKNKRKPRIRGRLAVVSENPDFKRSFLKINCDIVGGKVSCQEYLRTLEKSSNPFEMLSGLTRRLLPKTVFNSKKLSGFHKNPHEMLFTVGENPKGARCT